MMTIQECLDNFMGAVKGRDVRQALYDSVKQSYDYAKDANDTAHAVEDKTSDLLEDASQALTNANTAVTSANAAAVTANTASQTALDAAKKAEEAASQPGEFAIDYTDSADDAATALTKITPGAKLKDLVSNIKAVLNGAVLISKIANNLTTTDTGMVLGAAMGKSLDARITALNNNLAALDTRLTLDNSASISATPLNANVTISKYRINNKIIMDISSSWIAWNRNSGYSVVGWTSLVPRAYDAIFAVLMNGDGSTFAATRIDIQNTELRVYMPFDWKDGTYAHLRAAITFYV